MSATPFERQTFEQKRDLAKQLFGQLQDGDRSAALRMTWSHHQFQGQTADDVLAAAPSLADCQLTVATESGFRSWEELRNYLQQLENSPQGSIARFENAVLCLINGQRDELADLLRNHPALATARSPRSHQAVLLHYVAANGVENEHQRTPENILAMTQLLLDQGATAVIDATADIYGGGPGSTPLIGLVTSCHPADAGWQAELVRLFCHAGANANGIQNDGLPIASALAFRYPAAAKALHECGAHIDNPVFASALGCQADVEGFLGQPCSNWEPVPDPFSTAHNQQNDHTQIAQQAFVSACMTGRIENAMLLLDFGVDINAAPNRGATALHEAAFQGHLTTVEWLLKNGADKTLRDQQWDSTPGEWAEWKDQVAVAKILR